MEKLEVMLQLAPVEKIGTNTTRDTKESPFLFDLFVQALEIDV